MKKSRKIECIAVVVALVSAAGLWLAMPDIHRGWYFGFGFIAAAFTQNVLAASAAKKKAIDG